MPGTFLISNLREPSFPDLVGNKIEVDWTSDGGGDAVVVLPAGIVGWLVYVDTTPDSGGTAPTAYDLTLKDSGGLDLLGGNCSGDNERSATIKERFPGPGSGVSLITELDGRALSVVIAGAGASKGGIATFGIRWH